MFPRPLFLLAKIVLVTNLSQYVRQFDEISRVGKWLLICTEIRPKNRYLLHRKLTRLRLSRSLKTQQLALLDPSHFQVAKSGSIQHANQQGGIVEGGLRPESDLARITRGPARGSVLVTVAIESRLRRYRWETHSFRCPRHDRHISGRPVHRLESRLVTTCGGIIFTLVGECIDVKVAGESHGV